MYGCPASVQRHSSRETALPCGETCETIAAENSIRKSGCQAREARQLPPPDSTRDKPPPPRKIPLAHCFPILQRALIPGCPPWKSRSTRTLEFHPVQPGCEP